MYNKYRLQQVVGSFTSLFFLLPCSGQIISFEVTDGGMICSSGVCLEAMGDKNDDCYIVNAAVYVGY